MAKILNDVSDNLRNKINAQNGVQCEIESDDEYFYAVGQLVNYFISINKSNKKTHSLANPFFNAKNDKTLKNGLVQYFKKYNYDIDASSKRFNRLYGMVLGYVPENDINSDLIIAGYLRDSLIYEKNKVEK